MLDFELMAQQSENILSVWQLTKGIKSLLETNFEDIALYGEISNFKRHSSGHLYFTLKDDSAQMAAVMFRGNTLNMFFSPRDGMEVIVRGSITVYEPRGNYQILVKEMNPRGEGALRVAFEKLKQQLFEEGLFDEARKKPVPGYPETIAIITSPTGAAIHDMLSIIRRKNPAIRVLLVPVQVQGADAGRQIADAIGLCNEYGGIDAIIVGRGGGSLEDLWAFNEEIVARAIASSAIPIVSAVGHEVDVTISDYVADARAATPSVAAELLVPDRAAMLETLRQISVKLNNVVHLMLEESREHVKTAAQQRVFLRMENRLRSLTQTTDEQAERLADACNLYFERTRHRLTLLGTQLEAHNADRILKKGFSILRSHRGVVSSVYELHPLDRIQAELRDGSVSIDVITIHEHHGEKRETNV